MRSTFTGRLREFGLLHELLVPEDILVTLIIQDVVPSMTAFGHRFPPVHGGYQEHEALSLTLLAIHDRGIARHGPARLRRHPLEPTWTIAHLLGLTNRFGIPEFVIENNRIVLFLGELPLRIRSLIVSSNLI